MKALGMRKRALNPSWLWVPRWVLLTIFGGSWIYGSYALFIINKGSEGFVPGMIAGAIGCAGILYVCFLAEYAVKRIKLGKKVKRFYAK